MYVIKCKHILILAKPWGKLDDIITNMQISVIFIRYRTENNYIVYGFFFNALLVFKFYSKPVRFLFFKISVM